MKRILLFLILISSLSVYGQEMVVYTLDSCRILARHAHPMLKDFALLDQMLAMKIRNFTTQYYPRMDLTAQATYQSDITSIDVTLPFPGVEFPSPSRDQYRISLEMSQMIYDGGATRIQKSLEETSSALLRTEVELTLFQLDEQVSNLFFSLLLLQEKEQVLELMEEVLRSKLDVAATALENGILLRSDYLNLSLEMDKLRQQKLENRFSREEGLAILEELTGLDIRNNDRLELPALRQEAQKLENRPEMIFLDRQKEMYMHSSRLSAVQRIPKLMAFGQIGYGKPGLNMLSEEFDTYYLLGARLSWNLWDWNRVKRERSILQAQAEKVNNQSETFRQRVSIELTQEQMAIDRYRELLETDLSIIAKQEEITRSAGTALENGSLNSTDYLSLLNAEKQARINEKIHHVMCLQHLAGYNHKSGN